VEILRNTILVAVGLYLALVLFLYFAQESFIFQPERLDIDYQFEFNSEFEEINLDALDGAILNALHFKADSAKGLILYFHGNAGSLRRWGDIAQYHVGLGYDVLVMDYRKYGKSRGTWSYENFLADADLFYQYALENYDEHDIVLYGRSLGTGLASWLASKYHPGRLILEAPYTSLVQMAQFFYPLAPGKLLINYNFAPVMYLKDADCPIHIFHGDSDMIVPFSLGEKLFNSLARDKEVEMITIEGGGHNNMIEFQEFRDGLERILD